MIRTLIRGFLSATIPPCKFQQPKKDLELMFWIWFLTNLWGYRSHFGFMDIYSYNLVPKVSTKIQLSIGAGKGGRGDQWAEHPYTSLNNNKNGGYCDAWGCMELQECHTHFHLQIIIFFNLTGKAPPSLRVYTSTSSLYLIANWLITHHWLYPLLCKILFPPLIAGCGSHIYQPFAHAASHRETKLA